MPQTVLSRQLLLLPALSLETFLAKAVLDNPYLEPCFGEDDRVILCGISPSDSGNSEDFFPWQSVGPTLLLLEELCGAASLSLQDALVFQAHLQKLSPRKMHLVEGIIGMIDDNGYFRGKLESFSETVGCTCTEAEAALHIVQGFSPPGVGARDLSECLFLQIPPSEKENSLLRRIILEDLPAVAHHRYSALERKYHVSSVCIQRVCSQILSMTPKPGAAYSADRSVPYIYPDASVRRMEQQLYLEVRGSAGSLLRFDRDYLRDVEDPEAVRYLREKRTEAINLMNCLQMRYHALYKLLRYVVDEQRDFFLAGPSHLRPMFMKEAAKDIGMHLSTVSRCVSGKYLDTPWGIYPLRHFFQTTAGKEGLSAERVRYMISGLIAAEDKAAPLRDQEITDRLAASGIYLSRRAVSKYRMQLGIGSQRERRQYR